jgi:hypothetical protein
MGKSIKNRVFGSDIPNIIKKRIESRQLLSRKNREPNEQIRPSAYPDERTSYYTYGELNEMNFDGVADLSSRTPFARMWTAVNVATDSLIKTLTPDDAVEWENKKEENPDDPDVKNRYLKEVGESTSDKNYEVHEWIPIEDSEKIYVLGNHILGTEQVGPNTPRTQGAGGVSADVMREILPFEQETDQNAFLKPPAGITGVNSSTSGPLGAIKKTTVAFTVHNFHDFEKIYLRYFMKPGAQVFIDFGWDTGHLYDPKELLKDPNKIESKLYGDTGYVTISKGDMESLYGHVINYDAKVRDDGGFDCSVEIVSKNAAILSNSFDQKLKDRVKYGLDIEVMAYAISGVLNDVNIYNKATKWGQGATTEDELRYTFTVSTIKMLGGTTAPLPGMKDTEASMAALEHGVFYAGSMEENMKLFVNYGWFEDRFLNKELGFSDDQKDLVNENRSSVENDEEKLMAKFNSKNSFIGYNEKLKKVMMHRGFYDGAMFLYPASWGVDGDTYNIKKGMIPDRYDDEGNKINLDDIDYAQWEKKDKEENKIPLREIFVSVDAIKSSFDKSNTTSEFLKSIMSQMKEFSGGIVDLGIQSNNYGQHTISFIDKNLLSKGSKITSSGKEMSEFLKKLLVFNPYSPDTIVKEYDLGFTMPQSGLGNMIAIQSSDNLGGGESINDELDSLLKLEEMDRKEPYNDKFVRYHPSVGKEAGKRFTKVNNRESAGTFNFKEGDILHGQKGTEKTNDANVETGVQKGASYSEWQEKLYVNLDRAVNEDINLEGEDTSPEPTEEKKEEDTKKSEEIIAKNKSQSLVATPYNFWIKDAVRSHQSTVIPLLPIEVSLKIYGISGLMPGDLLRVNYLPRKYYLHSYFQIIEVGQDVGSTWDTSIKTQMRIAPYDREVPVKDVVVGKSYLRNVLKLEKIENFIHAFGNLTPIDLPRGPNGNRLNYIDNIFKCIAEGTLEGNSKGVGQDFHIATNWSTLTVDALEKIPSSNFKWNEWYKGSSSDPITPDVKYETNKQFLASMVPDVVTDDLNLSGFDTRIEKFQKGCEFYIITSGNHWTISNTTNSSLLDDLNSLFEQSHGKDIDQKLKDKSWKAVGEEASSTVGEFLAPAADWIEDAGDAIEEKFEETQKTIKDIGGKVAKWFGGWW